MTTLYALYQFYQTFLTQEQRDEINTWLCLKILVINTRKKIGGKFGYNQITFDKRVTFWLQHIRLLSCACAYVALSARWLAYNHYAIMYTMQQTHMHKAMPGIVEAKSCSLVGGSGTIIVADIANSELPHLIYSLNTTASWQSLNFCQLLLGKKKTETCGSICTL